MSSERARFNATIIIGVVGVIVSSMIFFAAVSFPDKIKIVSFLSILFSEILTTASVAFVETRRDHMSGIFFRTGIYSSLFVYLAATILIAILFMAMGDSVRWLITSQTICLGFLITAVTALTTSSRSSSSRNFVALAHSGKLRQLENRIGILCRNFASEAWSKQLTKIQEEIQYGDHSLSVPVDDVMAEKLSDLENILSAELRDHSAKIPENIATSVSKLLVELAALANQRTREASNARRGGF